MAPSLGTPLSPQPSVDLKRCVGKVNFQLAWDRLLRAAEPSFKWYWRPSAAIASTISDKLLDRLRKEFAEGKFHPDHVCLLSEPKPSTLLRHKALLSIGDQIVYQAIVNVIADKVFPHVRARFGVSVFGNLYAGPKSKFFMQEWRVSYQNFNDANRKVHGAGKRWLAQFDFASFYDSIGHEVLSTLLQRRYQVGADLCDKLVKLLIKWSSAGDGDGKKLPRIYLEHGIPQGPQPSPLLAEVVLSYIDEQMTRLPNVIYLRYADDIRIWGASEASVRYAAAILDRLARNLGVYPQAKKFGIDEVEDIEEILKTVSLPGQVPEPEDDDFALLEDDLRGLPPMRVLWNMLREFAESGEIKDVTRFKFVLGAAKATDPVAIRLCALMRGRPELTETCCYYIERLETPSGHVLDILIDLLDAYPGYPWMVGRLLRVIWKHYVSLTASQRKVVKAKVKTTLTRTGIRTDCQLQGVGRVLAMQLKVIRPADMESWAVDDQAHWWSVVYFTLNVDAAAYGQAALTGLLLKLTAHSNQEVCRAAAYRLCLLGVAMPNQPMDTRYECKAIFRKHGLAARTFAGNSRLNHLFRELAIGLDLKAFWYAPIDWRGILQGDHEDVIKYVVRLLAEHRASRDQFILILDSALETVFDHLWTLGAYPDVDLNGVRLQNTNRGTRMRSQTQFSQAMPETRAFMKAVNDLRNRSEVAHRRNNFSRTRNRAVSFDDVRKAMKLMPAALVELARLYPGV